ncbi:MAG: hypothetical protein ACRDJV_08625 [Actinomycetota bacterium]
MRIARRLFLCMGAIALAGAVAAPAAAHHAGPCRRAVVFTLPGITWRDVEAFDPPELLDVVAKGASGSMSVRTNSPRTSYASGFAIIGAGARVDGTPATGGLADEGTGDPPLVFEARVTALEEVREMAEEAGYGARPGALATALEGPIVAIGNADFGSQVATPLGPGRWSALAAMDEDGVVELSATYPELLEPAPDAPFGVRTDETAAQDAVDAALRVECASMVVDHGDLERADQQSALSFSERTDARLDALLAADDLLAYVRDRLDPTRDLLIVVSPTSPAYEDGTQLGIAVVEGPGYPEGSALTSSSTRRRGVVTLTDVAPTILEHAGIQRPGGMTGRALLADGARADPVTAAVELNDESVFVDSLKGPISFWFVICQVVVYVLVLALLKQREARTREGSTRPARWLEAAALALVAFPISTFLGGIVRAHELGTGPYVLLLLGIDLALVVVACFVVRGSLDRLLVVSGLTLAVLVADLIFGARLQLNTVFGYSPIVAGRFAGAGNIAFAVIGASTILTGTLIVHRERSDRALWAVAGLFAAVVVVIGLPTVGSDVGGVIALVPSFAITWVLLSDRRPSLKLLAIGVAAAVVVVGLFLIIDLAGPPGSRTHLGRLYEDVRDRGVGVLYDTVRRKASSNLRVFRTTIWTYFVPPALAVLAWLLARPRGRWRRLARTYPKLRAGLLGGLVVAVLGFAVNDSGIVIPAMVLSFLVPMAVLVHLVLDMGEGGGAEVSAP